MQSFVKLYNATVEAIQKQLTTKPAASAQAASEAGDRPLFGDRELSSLLNRMRQTMYEPIAGLPAEMASPSDIGLSTGRLGCGGRRAVLDRRPAQARPRKARERALKANPAGAEKMLQKWAKDLQGIVNARRSRAARSKRGSTGDGSQISELKVAHRDDERNARRAPESAAGDLRAARSVHLAEHRAGSWLVGQTEQLNKSGL